jgi:hypothetical protein
MKQEKGMTSIYPLFCLQHLGTLHSPIGIEKEM